MLKIKDITLHAFEAFKQGRGMQYLIIRYLYKISILQ